MYVYGIYLMHGGTYEGFLDLDMDDVQMMYAAYRGDQEHMRNALLKGFFKMFGGESR